jgi:hypothetical protein
MRWKMLPIPEDPSSKKYQLAIRLNSLGSLFFFEKHTLQRDKMSTSLHKPILDNLEGHTPRFLFEMPRDHLKTTMVTEGRSIWRVLPFNEKDEIAMRELGYGDEWIRWMRLIHNPGRRILIVSEVLSNAIMLGERFNWHFESNQRFRHAFPDIMPNASCRWTDESKQILSPERGPNGEGTFDFMGVGAALQSRHYSDVVEDDVVGKNAIESEIIMGKTHDYHKLLMGAFVSLKEAEWTVVNNRWAPNDLSAWIRENNKRVPPSKQFIIEHHSALGGCCHRHPSGEPIFPEEFTLEDFQEIRETQGPYFFSHQYLNLPVSPEECIFKPAWLNFYGSTPSPIEPGKQWLRHEVKAGQVLADINPKVLIRSMVIDPNHSEDRGRSRHAIVVTGFDPETDRIYLLDLWAKSASYDDLVQNIFKLAYMWGIGEAWCEAIAGQRLLRYPIEYMSKVKNFRLNMRWDLKTDRGANAKRDRIESLEPIYRNGQFWCRRDQTEFLDEYHGYPGHPTKDILDALGYATQTWNAIHAKRIIAAVRARKDRMTAQRSRSRTGY